MRYLTILVALCLAAVTLSNDAQAVNTYLTNPFGIAYRYPTGVSQYGKPGGMLIASNCIRNDSAFTTARANGAEVLVYVNPVEDYDYYTCAADNDFYNGGSPPLWPFPSIGQRTNYPSMHLTDIRRGSAWSNRVVAYIENLMRENKVDGVFLDVVGGRLWTSLANWTSWPQWEKDAWTDGNVDLVRRLDASRRALNPRFIIVNNNVWDRGDSRGNAGEPFVDGVVLEHHAATSTYHRGYAGHAFSNLGHRRVLVMGKSTADAVAWTAIQGVTHVSDQPGTAYAQVSPPPVAFHRLTDRPKRFGRSSVGTIVSAGLGSNYRRGSRFTLSDKARLLRMYAYLDGSGGPSGSQSLRMNLYRDSNGAPGTLVAQSNAVSVASGKSPGWVIFSGPASALDPGRYWIMLHSGSTSSIARMRGDGLANWFGSADTYSDGAANPGGAGSLGTQTLSLFASYTVGY